MSLPRDEQGISGLIGNPTNHLDYVATSFTYDLIHGNRAFSTSYTHPRGFFGLPLSFGYLKYTLR